MAWAFAIELNVCIYFSFKRRQGLYFWSLLVCSWGIILHGLGFLLRFPDFANVFVCNTIITIGWYGMVTGQALVLYSRLHLVVKRQDILRGVLIMIIWNAVVSRTPFECVAGMLAVFEAYSRAPTDTKYHIRVVLNVRALTALYHRHYTLQPPS